jgi:hypothetical protein
MARSGFAKVEEGVDVKLESNIDMTLRVYYFVTNAFIDVKVYCDHAKKVYLPFKMC